MDLVSPRLVWDDVAPERRLLDLGLARGALESVVERAVALRIEVDQFEEWIDEELCWHFGIWLAGWRSGFHGGPVGAYQAEVACHALSGDGSTDPDIVVRQILGALVEWEEYLEALDLHFAALPDSADSQLAVARITPMIQAKTRSRSGWERTLEQALAWYLETRNPTPSRITGQDWLAVRCRGAKERVLIRRNPGPLRQDGHLEHIERKERDPCLLDALGRARKWAEGERSLTLETLSSWHTVLTGADSEVAADFAPLVEVLAEADAPGISVFRKAAAAYLDIVCFRPYPEGNQRIARLAMDAILWRGGLALNNLAPVFVVARAAMRDGEVDAFATLLETLAGQRPRFNALSQ